VGVPGNSCDRLGCVDPATTAADAVSSLYTPKFEWRGGEIVKVVFDVADDAYADVEQLMAAAIARD
jgi:hypothetical protein